MTFTDLPDDLRERPLVGERLVADVLDLLISPDERDQGCWLFALCDSQDRLTQPCIVNDLPPDPPPHEVEPVLGVIMGAFETAEPEGALLVAKTRCDGLSVTEQDVAWAHAVARACEGRIRLLGTYLVTSAGSRPIPAGPASAAC